MSGPTPAPTSSATDGSAIIGTASSNAPLTVLGRNRSWLKVLVPGTAGQAGRVHTSGPQSDAGGIMVGPAAQTATPSATAPPTQVATSIAPAAAPTTTTPGATPPPAATGGVKIAAAGTVVRIWLSSLKSRELTERDWRQLQAAYGRPPGKISSRPCARSISVPRKAVSGTTSTRGRSRAGDEAQALCAKIKSRSPKSNCLIVVE